MSSESASSTRRAQVHDRHPVADVLDHAHVVGDEQVGQAQPALQVAQQVQDLGLDAHVQRAHRLVADHEVRLQDEGTGNADPLPLPAGELVRVAPGVVRREADHLHHLRHPVRALIGRAQAMDAEALADGGGDRRAGVERRVRILEHDLHPAPVALELGALDVGDIRPVEHDPAAGWLDQAQERPSHGRLAAAGLPHQAQRLATPDVEAHVVDRLHLADLALQDPAAQGEELGQMLDLDQRSALATEVTRSGLRCSQPSSSW